MIVLLLMLAQFTSFTDHRSPHTILEGHWQSCKDDSGDYFERVYDHNAEPRFELHLGPRNEFALFKGVQDEHREHDTQANLLWPAYNAQAIHTYRDARQWNAVVNGWKLWLSVVLAGGSRDECESYVIKLTGEKLRCPDKSPTCG